jgi:hypothetical protein
METTQYKGLNLMMSTILDIQILLNNLRNDIGAHHLNMPAPPVISQSRPQSLGLG